MISSVIVYIISSIIFIISLLLLYFKKSDITFMFRFAFFWIIITISIASLFFPLYYQKEAISQGVYPAKIQSFEFFSELRKILEWSYPENLPMFLKQYIFSSVVPMICIGVLLGFLIKMNVRTWTNFFLISFLVCLFVEFLKLFVCFVFQSWYLTVTPEDAIYLLIGCIIGSIILCIIRKILGKFQYKNSIMIGFKNSICLRSKRKMIPEASEKVDI